MAHVNLEALVKAFSTICMEKTNETKLQGKENESDMQGEVNKQAHGERESVHESKRGG